MNYFCMMNRIFGIILLLINFTLLQAATITVTNLNDTGVGSLRDALTSPATVNGDIIRFNPALIAGGSDTLRIYSTINVNKSLVVKGMYNNTDTLYISGQDSTRIFQINPGAANNFQLDSMVLVRGRGGVLRSFSANTLLLSNCIVSHNSTTGQGGSMYVGAIGLLHIQNSIFYKNQSTGQGGAIYLSGNGLIEESTFYDNTANGQGAGIYSSGLVEVDGSTFYRNNSNGAQGGAIYNTYGLTIRRSTICYNLGSAQGGSVYNTFGMEIYNSTIAYNSGGVFCNSGVGSLTLGNCVIGFDTAQQSMHYNATFNSLGYNVISPTQPNINLASSNNTDSLDFDEQYLKLLPLGNYGGPTLTMMPNASSYLVERGNPGDNTMAQNIPIVNIREIGAAEYINVVGNDTISSCDSVLYNGVWYYQDTVITTLFPFGSSSGIDSVHVVNIEVSSSIAITNPTITSCSPVSINGTTYYVDTTIVYTIPSNGTSNCDTIATQSIIVDTVPTTISQNGDTLFAPLGYTYQWLNCTTNSLFSGETSQIRI